MLERNELLSLMKATAKANRSNPVAYSFGGENLSYDGLNETLRRELNEYCGTFRQYKENQNLIFGLIEETIDEVLPKKLEIRYDQFAETKTFKQGDKPTFKREHNNSQNRRAKQFITRVGLAGIYEVFKLSKSADTFEVPTSAIGGAAQIGFEEFLDGRVDFAEVTQIVMEGMDELIQREVVAALNGALVQLPAANKVVTNGFDEAAFDRLLAIASYYGEPTIYCDFEFATKMVPAEGWVTEQMKNERWAKGYFATYKGRTVVITPNALVDETNAKKQLDAGYCWIIPAGGQNVKPVKIALEGGTIVDEYVNKDRSREIQVYKKVGVGVVMTPNIFCYTDTSLNTSRNTADMFTGAYPYAPAKNVYVVNQA
jgi:hypothetical protein